MKKIYILLFLGMIISSCKGFLEETPEGYINEKDFFQNEDDVERAVYSIYKVLNSQGLYGRYWPAIDVGTDDIGSKDKTGFLNFAAHALSGDQEWFSKSGVWDAWWTGVNTANFVISNVRNMSEINDENRNRILAEAMCMRAFFYFNIVCSWGDIPLIDWYVNNENYDFSSQQKREKVEDIYKKLIIPDLVFASEHAPAVQSQKGRATKWLAKLILADVYATLAGWHRDSETGEMIKGSDYYWTLARDIAKSVLDDNDCPFKLVTDKGSYSNAYARIWEEDFTDESMLEVGAISEVGLGSWLTRGAFSSNTGNPFWGANVNVKPFGDDKRIRDMMFTGAASVGSYLPTPELYHAMEKNDLRKWGVLTKYELNPGTPEGKVYLCNPALMKYVDLDVACGKLGTSFQYANLNFVIYRYAELMLLFAEADNEVNGPTDEAISMVNAIRNRAGLANLPVEMTADRETFREAIHQEIRIEFHGECKRRFDLIRWNKLKEVTKEMDVVWVPKDNMKPDGSGSYMTGNAKLIYVPSAPAPGCETVTEAPEVFYLLPLPSKEIYKTGWKNNFGY